jgi:hypothetical protein
MQVVGKGLQPRAIARDQDHVETASRQAVGIDRADPARSAGDEGGAAVTIVGHGVVPVSV